MLYFRPQIKEPILNLPRQQKQEPAKYNACVFFGLKPDGQIDILYDWEKSDDTTANRFAELMYRLNLGVFEKIMISHLLAINGKGEPFAKKTIGRWVDLLNTSNPVIRPLKVLRTEEEEE